MNSSSSDIDSQKLINVIATDIGSTTTKAILIKKIDDKFRLVSRGEAPTTVESPFENVTIGVQNAISEIESKMDVKIFDINHGFNEEIDTYVSTSSAGGGLQMIVLGLVKTMTAESAERAALGAGSIVMDVIAYDDERPNQDKIKRLRNLRPDIILFAGGTEDGNTKQVIELAEILSAANPKPRFGKDFKQPVIYAGNSSVANGIRDILINNCSLKIVLNIRPRLDIENIEPSRDAIHDFFLEHVMSHAPGYNDLMKWTSSPIMPTPLAFGEIIQKIADHFQKNLVGTDPGGATTDIFSVINGKFLRTVSANLGLSYSICNVLKETGIENITRWIPLEIDEEYIVNTLHNKMIRPTTIPQTNFSLIIEQALNREAMRLAFTHHKSLATGLKGVAAGVAITRTMLERPTEEDESYIKIKDVDMIIGSGGCNSHAPNRSQAALMLIDAFQPEGITKLFVDRIFIIPHLGVLYEIHPEIAFDILLNECLVYLGTCISPIGNDKYGSDMGSIKIENENEIIREKILYGDIKRIPINDNELINVEIYPTKKFDFGKGKGKPIKIKLEGGLLGLIIDGRGRPLSIPKKEEDKNNMLIKWMDSIGAYNRNIFTELDELVK